MENGQKIVFKGESEQSPDTIPGDLIITLKQKKHNFFKQRKRNDLYADVNLNLKEALFGYNKKIKHLDGREFYIESQKVTQPDETRIIIEDTIKLFNKLDKKSVCTGIENSDDAMAVEKLKPDYLQGYYYSKPLRLEELIQFLKIKNFNI